MSIAVLTQVYDEVRRLAIAGSSLAAGDFRLTKLAPPLEAAAVKAPVFGKVAEAIKKLTGSSEADSAGALLELSTLVSAILYTQGETGTAGPLQPIETIEFGLPASRTSARLLKPLIEALTTTGSGREELIKDAHDRGAFQDLRLVRLAVAALDDPYAPIAEYIADRILPMYGTAIYADLHAAYDPKARGGQVRRLKLMHRLDPVRTYALVEQALESGSAEMKVAAIQCLEGSPESLSYLLEQSRAKSSDVRRAALGAMARLNDEEVVAALIKALSGADLELAVVAASRNRSPELLKFLLESGEQQLAALLTSKADADAARAIVRFHHFCGCFAERDDKQSIAFLTACFERRDAIAGLKGGDGQPINRRVVGLLVRTRLKPVLKKIVGTHATLSPELLNWAILAALQISKPGEVYDLFSPYYLAKPASAKKRGEDLPAQKRKAIRELLAALSQPGSGRYFYGSGIWSPGEAQLQLDDFVGNVELDPRWLDAAIEADDFELVQRLARRKHKGTTAFLSRTIEELLKKKGDILHQASGVLETLIRVGHPQASEHFLTVLQKAATGKEHRYLYWITRLIPQLPKSAAPEIEKLLPGLDEKQVDQIAPYLAELQTKA